MGEVEELPQRKVARMCGHKVEKAGFHFGITEGAELGEFVFWDSHNLKAEDRCTQLPVVTDTAEAVRFAAAGIEFQTCPPPFRGPARKIGCPRKLQLPPRTLLVRLPARHRSEG